MSSLLVDASTNKSYLSFLPVHLKRDSIKTLKWYTFSPLRTWTQCCLVHWKCPDYHSVESNFKAINHLPEEFRALEDSHSLLLFAVKCEVLAIWILICEMDFEDRLIFLGQNWLYSNWFYWLEIIPILF